MSTADPRETATGKNAALAIKKLCRKYNRTLDEARCEVNSKRRVVYVLCAGRISSRDCFEDDLLIASQDSETGAKVPSIAINAFTPIPKTELDSFESTATLSSDSSSPLPQAMAVEIKNEMSIAAIANAPVVYNMNNNYISVNCGDKRKHDEIQQQFALLGSSASSPLTAPQTPSSSQERSPTNKKIKRVPRKKRKVLTLVPDGFTVAFCAFQHAWLGVVSCQSSFEMVKGVKRPLSKMVGLYKVTHVNANGNADARYSSNFCDNPTSAFRQAYGKKFGEPVDKRRPNGRLFFGFHYIKMQLRLRAAFEHQYLGNMKSKKEVKASKEISKGDERKLFDRWCGELAFRTNMLPWAMHESLIQNSKLKDPMPLDDLLKVKLSHAQDGTVAVGGYAGGIGYDTGMNLQKPSAQDIILSITTCSCGCSSRKFGGGSSGVGVRHVSSKLQKDQNLQRAQQTQQTQIQQVQTYLHQSLPQYQQQRQLATSASIGGSKLNRQRQIAAAFVDGGGGRSAGQAPLLRVDERIAAAALMSMGNETFIIAPTGSKRVKSRKKSGTKGVGKSKAKSKTKSLSKASTKGVATSVPNSKAKSLSKSLAKGVTKGTKGVKKGTGKSPSNGAKKGVVKGVVNSESKAGLVV